MNVMPLVADTDLSLPPFISIVRSDGSTLMNTVSDPVMFIGSLVIIPVMGRHNKNLTKICGPSGHIILSKHCLNVICQTLEKKIIFLSNLLF